MMMDFSAGRKFRLSVFIRLSACLCLFALECRLIGFTLRRQSKYSETHGERPPVF